MKKITSTLKITMLLFLLNIVQQTTAIASSVLPKAFSSKKAFSDFCSRVSKETGVSAEWVKIYFQNILHTKFTDLVLKLYPTSITAETLQTARDLAVKNEIIDVTQTEPTGTLTDAQMEQTGKAIFNCLNIGSEGKFAKTVLNTAITTAAQAQVPVSDVVILCEESSDYQESTVFSAEAVAVSN